MQDGLYSLAESDADFEASRDRAVSDLRGLVAENEPGVPADTHWTTFIDDVAMGDFPTEWITSASRPPRAPDH